ncbi:type II toxin-antitoxin system Phd/YefM family antitoxin [Frankia sp. Cj3]|uniref:type II toxin-antitoxin system Phd/YefM family antitoxin n=1 Tax=Frankia sp. Cj3 TaxID=2880976 RepID=UPI001EF479FF|nr:type II toxin-antitoxin system Phd/YefM family antitoxin [Frankia sp. Cj3]
MSTSVVSPLTTGIDSVLSRQTICRVELEAAMNWQVQEAKQRLSEVLRAVQVDGPQTITRHGEEIAVIIDVDEYRRLTWPAKNLTELLIGPPYFDDDVIAVLEGVEAERKNDFPGEVDLGDDI